MRPLVFSNGILACSRSIACGFMSALVIWPKIWPDSHTMNDNIIKSLFERLFYSVLQRLQNIFGRIFVFVHSVAFCNVCKTLQNERLENFLIFQLLTTTSISKKFKIECLNHLLILCFSFQPLNFDFILLVFI